MDSLFTERPSPWTSRRARRFVGVTGSWPCREASSPRAWSALLKPLLPTDVVVCSDGAGSIRYAAKELGLEHHTVLGTSGRHAVGAWHIQNVNAYHSRLKTWARRFYGVATHYLENYLGWFRALDRLPRNAAQPTHLLALALGR